MRQRFRSTMQEVREGLRCSTTEAIFATIHVGLTQGVILTNYVLDLGASNFLCGVIQSLPSILQFTYLLSPLLVQRLRARKPVATFFSFAHRLSWMLLILLLYVDWSPPVKQTLMLLTLLFSGACAIIAANAWYSWMADLVPVSIRGSYYGRRNSYLGVTSLTTIFIGTQVLSVLRRRGYGSLGYTLCFGVAIVSAAFSAWILWRQHEPIPLPKPTGKTRFRALYHTIKGNPLLKKYLGFLTLWQFSMGVSAAFFNVYMVRVLKMSPALMGIQSVISGSAMIAGSRLWGRAVDRVGDRGTLLATGTFIALHVWVWMFSTEGFLLPVWIASVLGGFFWAGFNIVSFVWPQRICGENDQQHAYGILGIVSGPAFALGSILGGTFTTVLPQVLFRIGSFEFRHFHFVFALSSLGRLLAVLLISRHSLPFDRKGRTIPQAIVDSFRQIVGWQ